MPNRSRSSMLAVLNQTEPTGLELRQRIARWLRYYWIESGLSKTELGEIMDLTKVTVGNVINEKEMPGLDTLVKMHFRLGADLRRVVRDDPPEVDPQPSLRKARK